MVNIGIRPSVNSFKTSRDERQVISVRSRIIRLTNNQTKKAEKERPFPKKKRKRRQECGGYCENGVSDGMCLARLGVIIGCSKRQRSLVKPDAKKSWDPYEEHDSLSIRYVKQLSGKRKDHRWEKYKSKILITEFLTL